MSETLSSADEAGTLVAVRSCQICGHTWIPRKAGTPKRCPSCKSEYWDRPDARKKKRTPKRLRTK